LASEGKSTVTFDWERGDKRPRPEVKQKDCWKKGTVEIALLLYFWESVLLGKGNQKMM